MGSCSLFFFLNFFKKKLNLGWTILFTLNNEQEKKVSLKDSLNCKGNKLINKNH